MHPTWLGTCLHYFHLQDGTPRANDATSTPCSLVLVLVALSLASLAARLLQRPVLPHNAPMLWKPDDWPLLGALRFFTERSDMVLDATAAHESRGSRSGNFSFFVGKKHVVGIGRSAEARIQFYEAKEMGLVQATAELLSGLPLTEGDVARFGTFFVKMLNLALRGDKLAQSLPPMVRDARAVCQRLLAAELATADPQWRVMDPFDVFEPLVYQMTTRTLGAHEVAEDQALSAYTLGIFQSIERRNSVAKVFVPWLPTPAHALRMWDGFRFYRVTSRIVAERRRTGVTHQDTMQMLMDSGASIQDITTFQLNSLFGGLLNTALNLAWVVLLLGAAPAWRARAVAEVAAAVARHRIAPAQPAADVLDALPLAAWQAEFPLLVDACLPEAIRLTMRGTPFRKNLGARGLPLGAAGPACPATEAVPAGAYAAYLVRHVHFDPRIYPDPARFDPGRFEAPRVEHRRAPHAYLGWGSGRHPCLGTRFAKLETALALAYFLAAFDFETAADGSGAASGPAPALPPRNVLFATRPDRPVYVRYRPRANGL